MQEKKNQKVNKFREFILNRIRHMFLAKQFFWKDYADNLLDAKKFVAENGVIAIGLHSDVLDFYFEKPVGENEKMKDPLFVKALIDTHVKTLNKEFRKNKRAILFYVDDNFITRALGFKETYCHYRLVGYPKKENHLLSKLVSK